MLIDYANTSARSQPNCYNYSVKTVFTQQVLLIQYWLQPMHATCASWMLKEHLLTCETNWVKLASFGTLWGGSCSAHGSVNANCSECNLEEQFCVREYKSIWRCPVYHSSSGPLDDNSKIIAKSADNQRFFLHRLVEGLCLFVRYRCLVCATPHSKSHLPRRDS